jgi:hypothetical protein
MHRTLIATAVVVFAAGVVRNAEAVWVDTNAHCSHRHGYQSATPCSVQYIRTGYHRNVDWPWPYICPDRRAVREPFCIMVNNGWRRQNLLGPHHFNADANQLTTAGELRVQWIMTQAPANHRNIFVERALDPAVTTQRLATAREYATRVTPDAQAVQVVDTHLISEGRPASVVDATNTRFQESSPPPVLPAATVSITGQ